MKLYTLYHGDCLDYFSEIAPGSVDAVICDIPSGRTACVWDSVIPFEPMWAGIKRVVKKYTPIVLLGCTQPFTSALVMSNPKWFRYDWVWDKKHTTGAATAKIMPLRAHESILLFGNSNHTYNPQMILRTEQELKRLSHESTVTPMGSGVYGNGWEGRGPNRYANILKYPNSVISIHAVHNRSKDKMPHASQKPLALLEYLVKTYTNEGDVVLDFTFGSGTTGAACGNLGRRFVGIERDKTYYDQGAERIATAYEPLRAMQVAS